MAIGDLPSSVFGDEFSASIEGDFFSPDSTPDLRSELLWKFEVRYHYKTKTGYPVKPEERFRPEVEIGIFGNLLVDN